MFMFKAEERRFHPIYIEASVKLPKQFTYPFYYQPHPLCITAAEAVKAYLISQTDFEHNFGLDSKQQGLKIGKMFGVMIVASKDEGLGYITAFSGKLAESNYLKGFVPPIYDTLAEDGFYKQGEAYTNVLSAKIESLEISSELREAKTNLERITIDYAKTLEAFKLRVKAEKQQRKQERAEAEVKLSTIEKQTIFENLKQKSIQTNLELKYLKIDFENTIQIAKTRLVELEAPIKALKLERKMGSASLQKQIHEQYRFLNADGETKDLIDIFKSTDLGHPPAAAGECAAPKLFQYAFKNDLKPIAMAEFWWGSSPNSEVRRHGQFYPSCRGKCEPILGHMTQGLDVEPNPIEKAGTFKGEIEIIYEDDFLLVLNKPREFLSVPGKTIKDSVLTRMQTYLPEATGPLLVHRLDMSTSGLLLVAKNARTHKNLQKQFINRSIKKRYVAVLNGIVETREGLIDLPLRVDFK